MTDFLKKHTTAFRNELQALRAIRKPEEGTHILKNMERAANVLVRAGGIKDLHRLLFSLHELLRVEQQYLSLPGNAGKEGSDGFFKSLHMLIDQMTACLPDETSE